MQHPQFCKPVRTLLCIRRVGVSSYNEKMNFIGRRLSCKNFVRYTSSGNKKAGIPVSHSGQNEISNLCLIYVQFDIQQTRMRANV